MARNKIVAANWKMNLSITEGIALVEAIRQGMRSDVQCKVVIAPPATHLHVVKEKAGIHLEVGAQNCYHEGSGAFTGEVSVSMLKETGVSYIITGHSERRQLFQESNEMIMRKVNAILDGGVTPIFCCGESLSIREAGNHFSFVSAQLKESLFQLSADALHRVVIAYEPIWAIGTGVTASPEQAQEMHAHIRTSIADVYDDATAQSIPILYGGSIKSDNATTLFSQPDVDGGLVGGASLQAAGFLAIIHGCG